MKLKIVCLIFLVTFATASASLTTLQMTNIEEEPQSLSFSAIPSFRSAGDPIDNPHPSPSGDPIDNPHPSP